MWHFPFAPALIDSPQSGSTLHLSGHLSPSFVTVGRKNDELPVSNRTQRNIRLSSARLSSAPARSFRASRSEMISSPGRVQNV